MQIETNKVKFPPITVTIETEEERDFLLAIMETWRGKHSYETHANCRGLSLSTPEPREKVFYAVMHNSRNESLYSQLFRSKYDTNPY